MIANSEIELSGSLAIASTEIVQIELSEASIKLRLLNGAEQCAAALEPEEATTLARILLTYADELERSRKEDDD